MSALTIKYVDSSTVYPNAKNSSTHSVKQIQKIARSIQNF